MKKKIFSTWLIAVMFLSLPSVVFGQYGDSSTDVTADSDTEVSSTIDAETTIDTDLVDSTLNVSTSVLAVAKERTIASEVLSERAQLIAEKKTAIQTKIELFEQAKADYLTAIQAYKLEKSDDNFRNALEAAKRHLNSILDGVISYLEEVRERIRNNPDFSSDAEAHWIARINAQIDLLNDLKTQVDAAETREEIMTAITDVKNAVMETRDLFSRSHRVLSVYNYLYILRVSDEILNAMQTRIDTLNSQGFDTSDLVELKESFFVRVMNARIWINNAQEALDEGNVDELKTWITSARNELLAAKIEVSQFVQMSNEISSTTTVQ